MVIRQKYHTEFHRARFSMHIYICIFSWFPLWSPDDSMRYPSSLISRTWEILWWQNGISRQSIRGTSCCTSSHLQHHLCNIMEYYRISYSHFLLYFFFPPTPYVETINFSWRNYIAAYLIVICQFWGWHMLLQGSPPPEKKPGKFVTQYLRQFPKLSRFLGGGSLP